MCYKRRKRRENKIGGNHASFGKCFHLNIFKHFSNLLNQPCYNEYKKNSKSIQIQGVVKVKRDSQEIFVYIIILTVSH